MTHTFERLSEKFFLRKDTVKVARDLLGKLLVVPASNGTRVSGMIVETEAYLGIEDKAAHSFGGRRTARNEITYAEGDGQFARAGREILVRHMSATLAHYFDTLDRLESTYQNDMCMLSGTAHEI